MFASGYELRDKDSFERTFAEFDSIVGFSYLRGMHINDSKGGIGSKLDRHDNLGDGAIGMECFRFIMSDSRFDNIPLILETPNEDMWPQEIKLLRSFEGN
jgi:deoxyribonuclease-4